MTNDEIQMTKENRILKYHTSVFWNSDFVIPSDFVIRHSSF